MLSRPEVAAVLAPLEGNMWIIGILLYGAGLRLEECLTLRVKDLDFERSQIVVRRGKGQKDRVTMLPAAVVDPLRGHLEGVRMMDDDRLVGAVRVLTDGYFFATVPEILVDPDYQRRGIGRELMLRAVASAPRGTLFFGAQPRASVFSKGSDANQDRPVWSCGNPLGSGRKKALPNPKWSRRA